MVLKTHQKNHPSPNDSSLVLSHHYSGVAGGATRAALTHHFAACGNAADVAAKEQSQEIATTMAGMILGMLLTNFTASQSTAHTLLGANKTSDYAASHRMMLAWILFALLTVFHVYANVRAMRCLILPSLNASRLQLLLRLFLNKQEQQQLKAEDYILIPSTTSTAVLTSPEKRQMSSERDVAAAAAGGCGGSAEEGGAEDEALLVRRSSSAGELTEAWAGLPSPVVMAGMEDLCPPPIRRLMSHTLGESQDQAQPVIGSGAS